MIDIILTAIGSTSAINFAAFCRGLGEHCPDSGDTLRWRNVFGALKNAEALGLVIVTRSGRDIETLRLSEIGAERIRARLDAGRSLLNYLERSGGQQ